MNRTFSSPIEQAKNMFLVLTESLSQDQSIVDEFLEDEGYNIDELNKRSDSFFNKLILSDQIKQASQAKQNDLENAQKYVENNADVDSELGLEFDQKHALEHSLFRGYKGSITPVDANKTIRDQAVLAMLNKKDEGASKSE